MSLLCVSFTVKLLHRTLHFWSPNVCGEWVSPTKQFSQHQLGILQLNSILTTYLESVRSTVKSSVKGLDEKEMDEEEAEVVGIELSLAG